MAFCSGNVKKKLPLFKCVLYIFGVHVSLFYFFRLTPRTEASVETSKRTKLPTKAPQNNKPPTKTPQNTKPPTKARPSFKPPVDVPQNTQAPENVTKPLSSEPHVWIPKLGGCLTKSLRNFVDKVVPKGVIRLNF